MQDTKYARPRINLLTPDGHARCVQHGRWNLSQIEGFDEA